MIEFDSEDGEALLDVVAKLRGKYDTQNLGEDITVCAFLLTGITQTLTHLMEKEVEKEERGEDTWLGEDTRRGTHLVAAAQYLNGAATAMHEAINPTDEEDDDEH